jgi:hypothetical protein
MTKLPQRLIFTGILFLTLAVVLFLSNDQVIALSAEIEQTLPTGHPTWETQDLNASSQNTAVEIPKSALPPPPNQNPCLHCHIKGEETGMWTPTIRWTVFLTIFGIFLFGLVRTTNALRNRVPWKPIPNRVSDWLEERFQYKDSLSKVLNKPVPDWQRRWWYCLGGLTAFFFVVQGLTGIMLAFYYKPTPEAAYASIQFIETEVRFGATVRMIHHWSANGMVLMCVAHMLRVFIMGAYKKPRELNWVSGVTLLIMTLAFGFTGYLLPWDQRAFWATTVGSEIAGSIPAIGDLALVFLRVGWDVTGLTLSRFYALHILILPLITLGTMGAHFIMVRRQGIMKPL